MALSRALSSIPKHISSTTTNTVMNSFRHQLRRNKTGFTSSVCTNIPGPAERISEKYEYNGYLTEGNPGPHMTLHTYHAFVFSLDVPGIRDTDLRCNFDGSKISFTAEESKLHRFGLGYVEPRFYEGEIEVDPLIYRPDLLSAEVKNGLLLIVIPKILIGPGSPWRGWIRLNFGSTKMHLDAEGKTKFLFKGEDY